MKIKKIVLMILLLVGGANAEDTHVFSKEYSIVNAYPKQYKGARSLEENKAYLNDQCFKNANAYIYDKNKQKIITIRAGDPEVLKSNKEIKAESPDYEKALDSLAICVKTNSNPIAAWEGAYIIKSYLGINYKKNIDMYKMFSKVLYEDMSCDGYLYEGDIFNKGIGTKPDKDKALEIYEQGQKLCANSWHKVVFQMKINNIKR
jgi:hypothetical protein